MSYKDILPQERVLIEEYGITGKSIRYIAKQMDRSKSTIKYDLDLVFPYSALRAQFDYDMKRSVDLENIQHILDHLEDGAGHQK